MFAVLSPGARHGVNNTAETGVFWQLEAKENTIIGEHQLVASTTTTEVAHYFGKPASTLAKHVFCSF